MQGERKLRFLPKNAKKDLDQTLQVPGALYT